MWDLRQSSEPLAPGRYVEPDFLPRISFVIPPRGNWYARQKVEGFFDVQLGPVTLDVIAVQLCRPSAVHAGGDHAAELGSIDHAIAALRSNPDLAVGSDRREQIGGQPSTTIDVDTTTPRDSEPPIFSPVIRIPAGPISLASARRLRISWIDLADGPLAVLVGGSIARWDQALEAAAPIVASIRFEV